MGILKNLGQKLKGEGKQIKGEFETREGKGIKGGMSKIEGKVDSKIADTKMRRDKERARNKRV